MCVCVCVVGGRGAVCLSVYIYLIIVEGGGGYVCVDILIIYTNLVGFLNVSQSVQMFVSFILLHLLFKEVVKVPFLKLVFRLVVRFLPTCVNKVEIELITKVAFTRQTHEYEYWYTYTVSPASVALFAYTDVYLMSYYV